MSLDVYLENDPCPHCGLSAPGFDANITHNLNAMAKAAGIYEIVWRPEEHGISHAAQLIAPLEKAIELMKSDPSRFQEYDAPNGWGKYEHFVPWLEKYLVACKAMPDAKVRASR